MKFLLVEDFLIKKILIFLALGKISKKNRQSRKKRRKRFISENSKYKTFRNDNVFTVILVIFFSFLVLSTIASSFWYLRIREKNMQRNSWTCKRAFKGFGFIVYYFWLWHLLLFLQNAHQHWQKSLLPNINWIYLSHPLKEVLENTFFIQLIKLGTRFNSF